MRKKTRSTNDGLVELIDFLNRMGREKRSAIWKDLAVRLSATRKNRTSINVSRIGRFTKENDTVAVPGKLLGSGSIDHNVTVAALSFSNGAREKIKDAGGKCVSFEDLVSENPKGSNVKIMRGV